MPEKRLVIFDLDNTLVINRPAAKIAYESALRFIAKETKLEFDKLHNHWKKIVQRLLTEPAPEKRGLEYSLRLLIADHKISEQLISPALRIFEKELLENLRPMPGAKEIVSWLKEEGSLVAVAAGTDRSLAKKKLKATDLVRYIDFIVTASDVGVMKPHPDYFKLIMTELKVSENQTLIVSDSKKEDIEAGQKIGIRTIEIPSNNPHLTALKPELSEFLSFAK